MDEKLKKEIDGMSYSELLSRWRFSKAGDPMFTGEVGEHYKKVMSERQAELEPGEHSRISKEIGWGRP